MSDEIYQLDLRIVRGPKGGFAIAHLGDEGKLESVVQFVGNLNELMGSVSNEISEWNKETERNIAARFAEQNPTVTALPVRRGLFGRRS